MKFEGETWIDAGGFFEVSPQPLKRGHQPF